VKKAVSNPSKPPTGTQKARRAPIAIDSTSESQWSVSAANNEAAAPNRDDKAKRAFFRRKLNNPPTTPSAIPTTGREGQGPTQAVARKNSIS